MPIDILARVKSKAWSVHIEGRRVVEDIDSTLRKHIHDKKLRKHWAETNQLPEANQKQFNWEAIEHATRNENRTRTIGVVKLFSGNLATNATMKKWRFREDDSCPRCGQAQENEYHVLKCQQPSAVLRWEKKVEQLEKWMKEAKTDSEIRKATGTTLRSWKTDGPDYNSRDPSIQAALEE